MSTWSVVLPTNRPDRFQSWLKAWRPLFEKHAVAVFVCEDLDEPTIDHAEIGVFVLRRKDWPWWVPRGTDMCRSIGMLRAYRHHTDYILSLDDDTTPIGDPFAEYERVFDAGAVCSPYFDVGALTSFDGQMRGFPYGDRERATVGLQAGGWSGVLDFDARTQLELDPARRDVFSSTVIAVPKGAAVTVCAMNMAWRAEFTPAMWQLPLHEGRYNRWGDIWAGLLAKRVLDERGVAVVVNGMAGVRHERASDPHLNLEREAPGVGLNESMWELLAWDDPHEAFLKLMELHDPGYGRHARACYDAWLGEFYD